MVYRIPRYYLNNWTNEIRKEDMELRNGVVLVTFDEDTGRVTENEKDPFFVSNEDLLEKWTETKWEPKADLDKKLKNAIEGFTLSIVEELFDWGVWEEEGEYFNDLWGRTNIVRDILFKEEPHKGFRDFDQYFRTTVGREFPEDMADEIKMMEWESLAFIRTALKPQINKLINTIRQIDKGEKDAL